MNIIMAGIDYHMAGLDCREKLSFTKSKAREMIKSINKNSNAGVVLLSTCNRTEIYLSSNRKETVSEPAGLLCSYAGVDINTYKQYFYIKENKEAVKHLMEVSCGIHSMILSEDEKIEKAVSKTVDYIMYSIKEDISTAMFLKIKEGIQSRR